MKSTIFHLDYNSPSCIENKISNNEYEYEFTIPILQAYAVEYFVIQADALSSFQRTEDKIQNDKLIFKSEFSLKTLFLCW